MTKFEEFTAEVNAAVAAVIAASTGQLRDMPNVDYSLAACEAASEITGADFSLCKLFNRATREAAAALMFERARA